MAVVKFLTVLHLSVLLLQLILSDDLKVIEVLAKVCKDHQAEMASTLLHIFSTYDRLVPLINACLVKSVDNEGVCVCACICV